MSFNHLLYQSLFWKIGSFVSSFLLNLCLARFFEAGLNGQLNFFLTVLALALLIGSLNLDASIVYFTANDQRPFRQAISLALGWSTIFIAGAWFLAWWATPRYLSEWYSNGLFVYVGLYLLGCILTSYCQAVLYGQKNFTLPNAANTVSNLLLMVCASLLYFAYGESYLKRYYLPIHFSVFLLQGMVLAGAVYGRYKFLFRFQWPNERERTRIFRYTGYVLLSNLLFFLLYRIDYWLLQYFNPSSQHVAELGNYIQASKNAHIFILVSSAAGSVVFSTTASSGNAVLERLYRLIRSFLYLGIAGFLVIATTGYWLFTWIYGPSFPDLYPCLMILMPGIMAMMIISVTANYLAGLGKPQYNLYGVLIGLFVIVLGDFLLIPVGGIYGAALVSSIGYIVYSAYVMAQFSKISGFSWQACWQGGKSDYQYFQDKWKFLFSKNKAG